MDWCKHLGISMRTLRTAADYVGFVEEEPEIAKDVSANIITKTANLPKEERKEILKEFKGQPDYSTLGKAISMHPKVIAEHFSLIDEKTPIEQPDLALLSSKAVRETYS